MFLFLNRDVYAGGVICDAFDDWEKNEFLSLYWLSLYLSPIILDFPWLLLVLFLAYAFLRFYCASDFLTLVSIFYSL